MLLEFIATIATGFGIAGVILIVNTITRGLLPRWSMPVGVGVGMLAFTIWSEYAWLPRTVDAMPGSVEVVSTNQTSAFYRPWTYVAPLTTRFRAVDHAASMTHPDHPELVLTRVVLMGRWERSYDIRVMVDCARGRRADLLEGMDFDGDGTLEEARWRDMPEDDEIVRAVCNGE